MKALLILICFFCSVQPLLAQESSAPTSEPLAEVMTPKTIQVLLEKDISEALLEVKGAYYLFNPHDGSKVASGLLGKRFIIRQLPDGLKWGEEFPGIHQIYLQPRSPETAIFINGIQYSGSVAVYGIEGAIQIVNELDIEDYVKSILSSQCTSPLEPEVLSALAILARTDAYYRVSKAEQSFWHVAASDIRYQGSALVGARSPIEKAVESTKHLILVHPQEGKDLPFATAWTEHSAGKTASYHSLFRKDGCAPDRGVEAPHAALSKQDAKWSYTVSKKALAGLLDVNQIKSIELFIDKPSNKVYGIRVKDGASSHDIDFLSLQKAVGETHLLSSDFTISMKEDSVTFSGFGKGHGVGLCLYSATALAQNGENALKILGKFFPETYLHNLNAKPSVR
jgi:stage II sporulation protein D